MDLIFSSVLTVCQQHLNDKLILSRKLQSLYHIHLTPFRISYLEVFCRKDNPRNFEKIRKTPVPESLFNKAASRRPAPFLKRRLQNRFFSCEFCEISKNIFPYRTPPVAAFVHQEIIITHSKEASAMKQIFCFLSLRRNSKNFRKYKQWIWLFSHMGFLIHFG